MGELSNGHIPDPSRPLTFKSKVRKVPLWNCSQPIGDWRKCQQSTFYKTFSGSEFMSCTIVQLSPKPRMSDRRSNTICVVVERPDYPSGDDLVLIIVVSYAMKWKFCVCCFFFREIVMYIIFCCEILCGRSVQVIPRDHKACKINVFLKKNYYLTLLFCSLLFLKLCFLHCYSVLKV